MKMEIQADRLYDVFNSLNEYRDELLINMSEKGMVIRVNEMSNTALQAAFIPSESMEVWEVGEFPRIGIDVSRIIDYVSSVNDDTVTFEIVQSAGKLYKLQLDADNREYKFPMTDPDQVSGVPDQVPDLDTSVKITNDFSFISDFINDYDKGMGDKKNGYMYLSARDGLFYMWTDSDDSEMAERIHWEDFDDYDIDWSNVDHYEGSPHDESEEHITDCIMSMGYLDSTIVNTDTVNIYLDNHYPMKITSNWECGIKQSWMIPPRFPNDENRITLPERIIKPRSLKS